MPLRRHAATPIDADYRLSFHYFAITLSPISPRILLIAADYFRCRLLPRMPLTPLAFHIRERDFHYAAIFAFTLSFLRYFRSITPIFIDASSSNIAFLRAFH
jgi:hypothetical protein